jgi:hypothetical protein
MARPKSVNPQGDTKALFVLLPLSLHVKLEREAKKRGVPLSQVARERLAKAS